MMDARKIILLIVLSLFLEGNFRYYDFKGRGPVSPFYDLYSLMPEHIAGLLRGAGKWWGRVAHRRVPVTLLPDHVMLCVPKAMPWEDVEAGSPAGDYKTDIEVIMRGVARRHAEPGITFDENGNHNRGSGWVGYVEAAVIEMYRAGVRPDMKVALNEYHSTGSNHVCGNTNGHKDGPENYRAIAYTFEGEALNADR